MSIFNLIAPAVLFATPVIGWFLLLWISRGKQSYYHFTSKSGAAIIPAVVAAGAAVYGSIQQKNAAKKAAAGAAYQAPIDWQEEQRKALEGNLATLPKSEKLSATTNTFNQSESNRLMEQALPGWSKLQASMTSTAQNLMTNPYELDQDTQSYLQKKAAEMGVSSGARGGFEKFNLLKDFGVTSMQYGTQRINQAQSLFSTLASTAPRVNPMSPISMFVTPQQIASATQQENISNQQVAQSANNLQTQATMNQNQAIWGSVGSVAGSVDWSKMFNSTNGNVPSSTGYKNG